MKTVKLVFLLLLLIETSLYAAGPSEPTKDLKSTTKNTEGIDVPYKPIDFDKNFTDPKENSLTETDENNGLFPVKNHRDINWQTIPFLPLKFPAFKPAQDPELK